MSIVKDKPSGLIIEKDTEVINMLRPLKSELNVLTKADGSAILAQGGTTVVAAVNGPVEVKVSRIHIEKASVEAVYRPKAGLSFVGDRILESIVSKTCETALITTLYPRTGVDIVIQEVQDCGGILTCAVNAACLALINSGIEMKFLIAAASCMIDQDGCILLDPDHKQLKGAQGKLMFVFDNVKQSIVASHTEGVFTQAQYHEGLLKCRQASQEMFKYFKCIVQRYAPVI